MADASSSSSSMACLGCLTLLLAVTSAINVNKYCGLSCDINGRSEEHTICRRGNVNCGPDPRCGSEYQPVYLNEDDRRYIVDLHNYLRNKIAMGQETKGNQPTAANMNVLKYNKELESIAQCWVNSCNGVNGQFPPHDVCRRTSEYENVGQNIGYASSTNVAKLDVPKTIKDRIWAWYNEVRSFDPSWVAETRIRQAFIGHYTQLIWAETKEIGCAMSYYSKTTNRKWHYLLFACNYGPAGNILGNPVYEVGIPASNCKSGKKSPTHTGLCSGGGSFGGSFGNSFRGTFTRYFNFSSSFSNVFV